MTKVFFLVSPDPSVLTVLNPGLGGTRDFVNQGGLSRAALFNQVEASLSRLQTSYIDLLQVHAFDPTTPVEETMKALHDLVQMGKVRYLGACNMRAWQVAEMNRVADVNGWTPLVSVQVEYSLLYRPEVCWIQHTRGRRVLTGLLCHRKSRCSSTASSEAWVSSHTRLSWTGIWHGRWARRLLELSLSRGPRSRSSGASLTRRSSSGWRSSLAWVAAKATSPIIGANSVRSHNGLQRKQSPLTAGAHMQPERLMESIVSGKTLNRDEVKSLEEL